MNAALRPPESAGMGRGLAFALLAHGLLFVALSAGVSWRNAPTPAFEAELWSSVPVAAAPREEAPPPEPPPKAQPDRRAEQQRAAEEAAEQEAQIAIARERARKEREKREEAERQKKAAEAKLEKEKAEKEKQAKAEKAAKEAEAKREKEREAKLDALRQEQLKRIQGLANATGGPAATGTAQQSSGPSSGYVGRLVGHIRSRINFLPGATNPELVVRLTVTPEGRILGTKVLKASTDPQWDEAALRGLEAAQPLPRDVDGRVPGEIVVSLRPRE